MNAKGDTPIVKFKGSNRKTSSLEVEHLDKSEKTYNFEVEDFHIYYVDTVGISVHNACVKDMTRQDAIKHGKEFLDEGYGKIRTCMYRSADGLRTMHFDLSHQMYNGAKSGKIVATGVRNKLLENIHIFFL